MQPSSISPLLNTSTPTALELPSIELKTVDVSGRWGLRLAWPKLTATPLCKLHTGTEHPRLITEMKLRHVHSSSLENI